MLFEKKKKVTNKVIFNNLDEFEQAKLVIAFARDYYGYSREAALYMWQKWLSKRAIKGRLTGRW